MATYIAVVLLLTFALFTVETGGTPIINAESEPHIIETCDDPHAEYLECGSACRPSCTTPLHNQCTLNCDVGCHCVSGYILNADGKCVRPENCTCTGQNEELGSNSQQHYATCRPPHFAPSATVEKFTSCQCKRGFARNNDDKCVALSECPVRKCKQNEEWKAECTLPSRFQPRCPQLPVEMLDLQFCAPACVCKNGFFRDNYYRCVSAEECENTTPETV